MEGMGREAYAADVRAWIATEIRERSAQGDPANAADKPRDVLGIQCVLSAAFHPRPRAIMRSRRPYAFGSREEKRRQYEQAKLTEAAHAAASERYLAGDRTAEFPQGTYPPPILSPAA